MTSATTTKHGVSATTPLVLAGMLLLTIVALSAGYLAYSAMAKSGEDRGRALAECINRNIMRDDIPSIGEYCKARV
jgi:hypothetical protein